MRHKGFTLIELMVVILIVGILAAATIPLMRGRVDSAKWAEANATAGTIKSAVRVYFAEKGEKPTGTMDDELMTKLGFTEADLNGTYFDYSDYAIDSVDDNGNASVKVTSSKDNAPKPKGATKTLKTDGTWE